jgi:hypothetical protein
MKNESNSLSRDDPILGDFGDVESEDSKPNVESPRLLTNVENTKPKNHGLCPSPWNSNRFDH